MLFEVSLLSLAFCDLELALGLFFDFMADATVLFGWLAGLAGGLSGFMLCVDSIGDGDRVALELVGLVLGPFADLVRFVLGLFSEFVNLILGLFLKFDVLFFRDLDVRGARSSGARKCSCVGAERNGEGAHTYGHDCTDEYFSAFKIHRYFYPPSVIYVSDLAKFIS